MEVCSRRQDVDNKRGAGVSESDPKRRVVCSICGHDSWIHISSYMNLVESGEIVVCHECGEQAEIEMGNAPGTMCICEEEEK